MSHRQFIRTAAWGVAVAVMIAVGMGLVLAGDNVSSQEKGGRLLRLVAGELIEIAPSDPSFTGFTVGTKSGDAVEINPRNVAGRFDELWAIAEALGGWDQLDLEIPEGNVAARSDGSLWVYQGGSWQEISPSKQGQEQQATDPVPVETTRWGFIKMLFR